MELLPENFDEIWLKAIEDPQNLTRREIINLDRFIWARSITRWRSLYDLYERGLLEESAWQRMIREEAEGIFGNPFGRAYWADIKEWETTLPDDLVSAIDRAVAVGSSNSSAAFIDSLEKRLGIDRKQAPDQPPRVDDAAAGAERQD